GSGLRAVAVHHTENRRSRCFVRGCWFLLLFAHWAADFTAAEYGAKIARQPADDQFAVDVAELNRLRHRRLLVRLLRLFIVKLVEFELSQLAVGDFEIAEG